MRLLLVMISILLMSVSAYAQQILVDPEMWDPRFQPADKIHAWCERSLIIRSNITGSIKELSIVIEYDPSDIRIVGRQRDQFSESSKMIAATNIQYALEDLSTSVSGSTELARIAIASVSGVSSTTLTLVTWSYYIDTQNVKKILPSFGYKIAFVPVVECKPDITPPRIELVNPESVSQRLMVWEPVVIRISDTGKWVAWSWVSVEMMGWRYTPTTQWVTISGDIISIQPYEDFLYNTGVSVTIKAQDSQVYGWPNASTEQLLLQTSVKPEVCKMLWCQISSWLLASTSVSFSPEQCQQLSSIIARPVTWSELSTLQSWWCTDTVLNGTGINSNTWKIWKPIRAVSQSSTPVSISLLALIWRFLFVLSFVLQIRYRYQYQHTKKLHQHKIFK